MPIGRITQSSQRVGKEIVHRRTPSRDIELMELIRHPIQNGNNNAEDEAMLMEKGGSRLVPEGPVEKETKNEIDAEMDQFIEANDTNCGEAV